ncbi:MAG: prolyl oligopeptidase family serine peptidase [Pirellula sp.]
MPWRGGCEAFQARRKEFQASGALVFNVCHVVSRCPTAARNIVWCWWVIAVVVGLVNPSKVYSQAPSRAAASKLRLQPHWIDDNVFWYSVETEPKRVGTEPKRLETEPKRVETEPKRVEYVLVDAEAKTVFRADSIEAIEERLGRSVLNTSGPVRVEPSATLSDERIEIQIRNDTQETVQLYWMDFECRPQPYGNLEPGESKSQSTFRGHSWLATQSDRKPLWTARVATAGEVLSIHLMEIQPSPILDRRGRGRRRNPSADAPPANVAWQVKREGGNLRFETADGEVVFDSAKVEACVGSDACRYDQGIVWSPNQRYAFTLQMRQGDHREVTLVESSPRDQLQPRLKKIRYDKPGDNLDQPIPRLFDMETKRLVPLDDSLFANPWSIEDVRWDADSSRVTFIYNQRGHQVIRWISIVPETGETRVLIDESSPTYIDYAAKAYREFLDDSQEVLWGSERSGWYHLYRFDARTGELRNAITRGDWVIRSIENVDRENRHIWFYAGGIDPNQDPYYRHLCRVDFDGGNLVQMTRGDGDHQVQYSPTRKWLIDTYSRVDMPPVHELRSAQSGEIVLELERSSDDGLWVGTERPERFVAKGRDGLTDIYGIIVRPSKMEPGKKYPVIEDIYAGPQDSFVPKAYSGLTEYHALAEKGFIVVKIDGMGTSNRSKAFHDVSYRKLADGGFPDRKLWMQSAAAKYPEIDIDRVGVYGGSAGGQNALAALLFHGDFYDAAVADCGCHDNRMDKVWWNELYMGWPIGPHYEENSNVVNAHRLQGRLMLVVGELDTNVDPASTMQVVDALIRADKDFELIYVPGGGHGIGSSAYCKRRRDAFFMEHLQK